MDTGPAEGNNGLICFTNCFLPQEDGSLLRRDLWIDEQRGVILDAQRTFFLRKERPDTIVDLGGRILSPGLIDIQINGAYDFDFSVYDGDDAKYRAGLDMVARRIVETGVTSLVPTIITQEKSLYPQLLSLLRPHTPPPCPSHPHGGATLLGWHAEGPFLQGVKRGAHAKPYLLPAPDGFKSVENIYGEASLLCKEDWQMQQGDGGEGGVRMVTAAPEVEGVMDAIGELSRRGIVVSIGHSIASSDVSSKAVRQGARLITHLFNAMPQLHHRDPGIIGLLGASPGSLVPSGSVSGTQTQTTTDSTTTPSSSASTAPTTPKMRAFSGPPVSGSESARSVSTGVGAEALDELETPPLTPTFKAMQPRKNTPSIPKLSLDKSSKVDTKADRGASNAEYARPFYGIIVDGVHSHPNSVRLAYTAHRDGCILITDAMKVLDPNMRDGVHDWRDGTRVVKEGVRLYIEGTDTLAGSVVTLDKCVRNFARFTGCSIGEAIKCATYNPARCLNIENKKGTLRPGADADLAVLDWQGHVLSSWVRGKQVWKKDATDVQAATTST